MKIQVVFTVLPRPVWTVRPSISIFTTLSPSADAAGATLADFPTLKNWPTIIRASSFDLYRLDGVTPTKVGKCKVKPYASAEAAQALWQTMLPSATRVSMPEAEPLISPNLLSFDFAALVDFLGHVYRPVVASRSAGSLGDVAGLDWWGSEEITQMLKTRATAPQSVFWDFARYHLPDHRTTRLTLADEPSADDFDQRLSEVGSYPALYRYLGLILDADIELAPGTSLPADGALAVAPKIASPHADPTELILPWSRYETIASGSATYAHMASDKIRRRGFYTLNPERIRVIQYDLNAATYGVMKAARAQKEIADGVIAAGEVSDAAPALSSPGFSLYDKQILADLNATAARTAELSRASLARGASLPDPAGPVLTAADTEAGCRVDVFWSRTNRWHSLCDQQLTAVLASGATLDLGQFGPSEGMISLATSSTVASGSPDQSQPKSSQRLFGFLGWSLTVPRPQLGADADGKPAPLAQEAFRWRVDAKVASGSLARLRFGDSYAFRCRSTDLAGNSWSLVAADQLANAIPDIQTEPQRFLRNEAISPPVVVAPESLTTGETKAVLAVGRGRSQSRRQAYAPRCSADLLEKHGVFDPLTPDASFALMTLAARRAATGGGELKFPYAADPIASGISALVEGGGLEQPLGTATFAGSIERGEEDAVEIILKSGRFSARQQGRKFIVSLPKGHSRRLRLRSSVSAADRKLLAFNLEGAEPPDTVTPAVDLLLVHPSEVPLAAPVSGRPAIVPRRRGETHIVYLDPDVTADAPTTSRLTFEGAWNDGVDDPQRPDWDDRAGSGIIAKVDVPLDPRHPLAFEAARHFPKGVALRLRTSAALTRKIGLSATNPDPSNKFDFQDTHAHIVQITPVAHARHAEFFADNVAKPLPGVPITLVVPSTANPSVPVVDFILPTAVRSRARAPHGQAAQRTEGWALRVFLQRDWRRGEQLAVVFGPPTNDDSAGPAPTELGGGVRADGQSGIGQDPLVLANAPLEMLTPSDLKGGERGSCLMPIDDRYFLAGDKAYAAPVEFVALEPKLDSVKNRRYVDLRFKARPAYMPFVRLILARYNPLSIPGAELSQGTLAQWAQLGGNRSISATRIAERQYKVRIVADAAEQSVPKSRTRFVAHAEYSEFNRGSEYGWEKDEGSDIELAQVWREGLLAWEAIVTVHPWRLLGQRRIIVDELLDLRADECGGVPVSRMIAFEVLDL